MPYNKPIDELLLEMQREAFDFAMEGKFCFAAFNILMPYPGTPLYARLRREGHAVARRSYHLQGKAVDIRLADVPLPRLR